MIPVCCICGKSSSKWHDKKWEDKGGLQDFCPDHANEIQIKYGSLVGYAVFFEKNMEKTNDQFKDDKKRER